MKKKPKQLMTITIVLAFMGISIVSFIPAAQGCRRKVYFRPIEDFLFEEFDLPWGLYSNEIDLSAYMGWATVTAPGPTFGDLWLIPHDAMFTGQYISDCRYGGFVIERDLGDGWAEFSVHLWVMDAYIFVFCYDLMDDWSFIFEGTMTYYFMINFRIEIPTFLPPPPDDPIPIWWFADYVDKMAMIGIGSGVFTDEAGSCGYPAGEQGNVMIAMVGYDLWTPDMRWTHDEITFF